MLNKIEPVQPQDHCGSRLLIEQSLLLDCLGRLGLLQQHEGNQERNKPCAQHGRQAVMAEKILIASKRFAVCNNSIRISHVDLNN